MIIGGKKINSLLSALLLTAGLSCSAVAEAEGALLAETELLYKSDTVKAQLWGNKLQNGYANNLTLVLKRKDGSVITGYLPDIKGGYGAVLKAVQVKARANDTQQLLVGVKQGDWRAYSEYRVLDIYNPHNIKALFTATDSFGIVSAASLDESTLRVQTIKDKELLKIALNPQLVEDLAANRRRVSFGRLSSLSVLDMNKDGVHEFLTNQLITADQRVLADVGAVWRYIGPTEDIEESLADEKKQEATQEKEQTELKQAAQGKDKSEQKKAAAQENEKSDLKQAPRDKAELKQNKTIVQTQEQNELIQKQATRNKAELKHKKSTASAKEQTNSKQNKFEYTQDSKANASLSNRKKASAGLENNKLPLKKEGQALPQKLWRQDGLTIMKADVVNKKNTINNGVLFQGGMIYPVKMVAPTGEATYPQFMLNEQVELEGAWNATLLQEAESYIESFLQGKADLAFNVLRADKKLLTVQLISGKESFVRHTISFIPGEKQKYELKDLLNLKGKGLVKLLNELNNNTKLSWDASLTDEWYLRGNDLVLMKNISGSAEAASFALKSLKPYIKDKRFMPEEEKAEQEQPKSEQKPAPTEK